jgi:hypothetical protein
VGEEISWSVIYDNSSTVWHYYDDGSNGLGEFGQNDDTIYKTYNWTNGAYGTDAIYSLDTKTVEYMQLPDIQEKNYSVQYHYQSNNSLQAGYSRDGFGLGASFRDGSNSGQFYNYSLGNEPADVQLAITGYSESPIGQVKGDVDANGVPVL